MLPLVLFSLFYILSLRNRKLSFFQLHSFSNQLQNICYRTKRSYCAMTTEKTNYLHTLPPTCVPFLQSSRILFVLAYRNFQIDKPTDTSRAGFLPPHVFSVLEIAPTFQLLEPNNFLFLSPFISYIHSLYSTYNCSYIPCIHFYSQFQFLSSLLTLTTATASNWDPYFRCDHNLVNTLHCDKNYYPKQ